MARMRRRDMLKLGVLGAAAVALPLEGVARAKSVSRLASANLPKPFSVQLVEPPVATPVKQTATTDYYEITMRPGTAQIVPGLQTQVWGYNGLPLGPTIRATRGRDAVVRQINGLPAKHPTLGYEGWTSVHLHGSASLPQYDGYASDITRPGEYKDYRYPNFQDARTLWYHDHGVHHTAENAYMGLAGLYVLHDELERSLPIPQGRYDVPLVLKDAMFAADGSLAYNDNSHSGLYGDIILVNGRPWPVMRVERRKYRFRILNASISRGYRLTLDTGDPLTVIGTDGGLMPAPRQTTVLRQGMAERYEVVIDFAKYRIGRRVVLRNLGVPNAVDYDNTDKVMAFDVVSEATDTSGNEVPAVLNPNAAAMDLTPAMAQRTRRFEFIRTDGKWTVNGRTWEDVVNSGYRYVWANPGLGDVEVWEFKNSSGGWFHPVHVHLIDFKILDRNGRPPYPYELGPKDVVYVGENETVRVIARFGPHEGRYMMHCHNLPHEDHDMMAQFQVGSAPAEHDPILADPAKSLPAPGLS